MMILFLQRAFITLIWLIVVFAEFFLLFAGLISQGHDKGRLISIAIAVIIIPVIGYALHQLVKKLGRPASS